MAMCELCHCRVSGGGNRHTNGRCGKTAPKDPHRTHHAGQARKRQAQANLATAGRGVAVAGTHKVSASSKAKRG
jgi:hypothetical protein